MAFNHLQPRDDWELNCLILKICQSLDQTEFEQLKLLCSSFNHVSRRVSDTLTTPETFFQYLKERRIIDRDNLLLLQTFLCHIGRDDLRKMAADYASQIGDTLHFITPGS
ncbi:hypothetical protein RRG08_037722 [Elysia crispata]|uniref:DED domain-containing protein n=1 Tax=Elysia crispata TaxID=231223 RepID=A0AAE1A7I4_9GAST|nr:hypothetical protein RRG08_037722 [Elysia crispata]